MLLAHFQIQAFVKWHQDQKYECQRKVWMSRLTGASTQANFDLMRKCENQTLTCIYAKYPTIQKCNHKNSDCHCHICRSYQITISCNRTGFHDFVLVAKNSLKFLFSFVFVSVKLGVRICLIMINVILNKLELVTWFQRSLFYSI